MYKDGLILALEEVQCQQGADEELSVGRLGERLIVVKVQEWAQGEKEEGWNQKRAEVFDDEDGAPCDLGACIGWRKDMLAECSMRGSREWLWPCPNGFAVRTQIFDMNHA